MILVMFMSEAQVDPSDFKIRLSVSIQIRSVDHHHRGLAACVRRSMPVL